MISYDLPAFSERVELDALDFGVIISPDADVFADFLDVFLFFSLGQFSLLFAAFKQKHVICCILEIKPLIGTLFAACWS